LGSADEEVRRQAVLELRSGAGPEDLFLLNQALGDASWRVRKAAVSVLKDFSPRREAVRFLLEALSDPDNAGRRSAAVEALGLIGSDALPALIDAIHHPDADVRKFVIDILGEIGDSRAVSALLPLTNDPAEVIRLAAVEALGSIAGDHAFESLLGLLNSGDVSLQFSVLHALGRMGRPLPFSVVKPLLKNKLLRRALFDALGQTRSPEAVEFIVEGLGDTAKSSRQAAVRALQQIASDPALMDLARQAVKKKLAGASLEPFAELLEQNHLPTKRAAVTLLSMIASPEALALLLRAASDDSIQAEVAEALSRMKMGGQEPGFKPAPADEDLAPVWREVTAPLPPVGPMSNEQFHLVRDLVTEESGLYYDRELKYLVERRVQRRMEDLGLQRYEDYFARLAPGNGGSASERRKLISLLSTNETYFFREDFQLRAFTEEILPALVKKKEHQGSRQIRIWSAGCSSGEEPYTIAMLIKETPGLGHFHFEIIGSDLGLAMLEKARAGLYTESSFRATPPAFRQKYFRPEGNRFRLSEEIRNMVSFDDTNLITCASAPHLRGLDVIFCRNVIIYFSPQAKLKVVEQFYRLLHPGGFLLLGHSESLMNVTSSFELVHLKNDLVYRKPEGEP
jgi:chemotaxis protein methyltransferase CheR